MIVCWKFLSYDSLSGCVDLLTGVIFYSDITNILQSLSSDVWVGQCEWWQVSQQAALAGQECCEAGAKFTVLVHLGLCCLFTFIYLIFLFNFQLPDSARHISNLLKINSGSQTNSCILVFYNFFLNGQVLGLSRGEKRGNFWIKWDLIVICFKVIDLVTLTIRKLKFWSFFC